MQGSKWKPLYRTNPYSDFMAATSYGQKYWATLFNLKFRCFQVHSCNQVPYPHGVTSGGMFDLTNLYAGWPSWHNPPPLCRVKSRIFYFSGMCVNHSTIEPPSSATSDIIAKAKALATTSPQLWGVKLRRVRGWAYKALMHSVGKCWQHSADSEFQTSSGIKTVHQKVHGIGVYA